MNESNSSQKPRPVHAEPDHDFWSKGAAHLQAGPITLTQLDPDEVDACWRAYVGGARNGRYTILVPRLRGGRFEGWPISQGGIEAYFETANESQSGHALVLFSFDASRDPRSRRIIAQIGRLGIAAEALLAWPQHTLDLNLQVAIRTIAAHAAGEWRAAPSPEFPPLAPGAEALLATPTRLDGRRLWNSACNPGEIWTTAALGGTVAFAEQRGALFDGLCFINDEGVTLTSAELPADFVSVADDLWFELLTTEDSAAFCAGYQMGQRASADAKARTAANLVAAEESVALAGGRPSMKWGTDASF